MHVEDARSIFDSSWPLYQKAIIDYAQAVVKRPQDLEHALRDLGDGENEGKLEEAGQSSVGCFDIYIKAHLWIMYINGDKLSLYVLTETLTLTAFRCLGHFLTKKKKKGKAADYTDIPFLLLEAPVICVSLSIGYHP